MTASQRTKYTKRRAQIWEALHPVERQVGQAVPPVEIKQRGHAQDKSFAAATAASTGQTKRTTNRALARADALGDTTLDKITGTSLDTYHQAWVHLWHLDTARPAVPIRFTANPQLDAKPLCARARQLLITKPENSL